MSNKGQYKSICEANPQIPVFLQYWWVDAVCADWDVAIVMNGDNVAGVWPYNKEQKIGVSLRRNPSLTPYLGPHIFFPHDLKESKRENFEHEITTKLLDAMPEAKVWHVALQPGQKHWFQARDEGAVMYSFSTIARDVLDQFTDTAIVRTTEIV